MCRRSLSLLFVLLLGCCAVAVPQFASAALAKDGGGDSGHGGGGHDDDGGNRGRGGGGDRDDDDAYGNGWDRSGSSEARGAVQSGSALPLARVLPVVRRAVPGRVLDVDLQRLKSGGLVYKFRVLTNDGAYQEVFVDALSAEVLQVRRR